MFHEKCLTQAKKLIYDQTPRIKAIEGELDVIINDQKDQPYKYSSQISTLRNELFKISFRCPICTRLDNFNFGKRLRKRKSRKRKSRKRKSRKRKSRKRKSRKKKSRFL